MTAFEFMVIAACGLVGVICRAMIVIVVYAVIAFMARGAFEADQGFAEACAEVITRKGLQMASGGDSGMRYMPKEEAPSCGRFTERKK